MCKEIEDRKLIRIRMRGVENKASSPIYYRFSLCVTRAVKKGITLSAAIQAERVKPDHRKQAPHPSKGWTERAKIRGLVDIIELDDFTTRRQYTGYRTSEYGDATIYPCVVVTRGINRNYPVFTAGYHDSNGDVCITGMSYSADIRKLNPRGEAYEEVSTYGEDAINIECVCIDAIETRNETPREEAEKAAHKAAERAAEIEWDYNQKEDREYEIGEKVTEYRQVNNDILLALQALRAGECVTREFYKVLSYAFEKRREIQRELKALRAEL